LNKYININSGTTEFPSNIQSYVLKNTSPPIHLLNINVCLLCTDKTFVQTAIPDISAPATSNKIIDPLITSNNCNIIPFKFYSLDNALTEYEELFNYHKTAFIPLNTLIRYINKKNNPMQN
jgi:hypothetical protein